MPDVHIESAWPTTEFTRIAVASHCTLQVAVHSGATTVHESVTAITFSTVLYTCKSGTLASGDTIQDGHISTATKHGDAIRESSQTIAGVIVATETGPAIHTGIHHRWWWRVGAVAEHCQPVRSATCFCGVACRMVSL